MTETVGQPVSLPNSSPSPESVTQHNILMESLYSGFNGVLLGTTFTAALPLAATSVGANAVELTILLTAFPLGAMLGPFWAWLAGPRGMQKLVVRSSLMAGLLLLPICQVHSSLIFTLLVAMAQMLISPIRLGQSTLYGVLYAPEQRGRIIGRLVFWSFLTMVPSVLLAGYLIKLNPQNYRLIYPAAGICGLIACYFFHRIQIPIVTNQDAARLGRARISFRGGLRRARDIFAGNRGFLYFQIAFFLSGSAFFMSHHVVLLLITNKFNLAPDELTLWLAVVPLVVLSMGSPIWGRILDRFGIARCRLLVAIIMTTYLTCYFAGVMSGLLVFVILGSLLKGVTNAGGQLTWYLGSSHYAPHPDEVASYHGIHLFLNGARGLGMPWFGLLCYTLIGKWAVLVAVCISFLAVPVCLRLIKIRR